MVSIVIVSHSLRLALGIEELAQQMSRSKVRIAVAAGIDDPQNPIGTDAIAIMNAIDEVWSPDGVLVFMDMGSAILSAEMALELLSDEQRDAVHLMAAPIVEGTLSAVVMAAAGLDVRTVAAEAMSALGAKQSHLHTDTLATEANAVTAEAGGEIQKFSWTVQNPNGIHARPAARIVALASSFSSTINVVKQDQVANAKSLNALARLSIRCGDSINVQASGEDATNAIQALTELASDHFGEAELVACPPVADAEPPVTEIALHDSIDGAVCGIVINDGVACGKARWYSNSLPEIVERPCNDLAKEYALLDHAVTAIVQRLGQKTHGVEGEIFAAHQAMLEDPELHHEVRLMINEGMQAEKAWLTVMQNLASQYRQSNSAYMRERESDVEDLSRQVLCVLCGENDNAFDTDSPCILMANDLMPSQIASLNKEHILGICLSEGGVTSHTAIIARSLGIPAIVKARATHAQVPEGQDVIIDGFNGHLWYAPDEQTRTRLQQKGEEWRLKQQQAKNDAQLPAKMKDGRVISVLANIGGPEDIEAALHQGAEGVGLFRTEFLFHNDAQLPDEEQQYAIYCQVASAFGDKPVTIRTLDIGGDKPLPSCPIPAEDNPFLGLRGIRLCLAKPELFLPQIRALLRASQHHRNIQIMYPMIATMKEVRDVRVLVHHEANALSIPLDSLPKMGVMIEVPAAVLIAEELAREVDFFSIGTNDLTQYIMAADRGNNLVSDLVDYRNPAVLKAIEQVCHAGIREGISVSMCGEMAGDSSQTELLLDFGLEKFSASAAKIPELKSLIRTL
ncbi:phosphoenolpyruvate--protein phosphotransferase [Citrobacter sp. NCU1]|uniref:phosphoenolpyruvate--protein phosphotransferase n=1 Tax=Citrobacter sp. NCU1 TaxID=2026683 RepID=UPI0013909349|nr:phosphoenolpyruvate--protein phosphotransferase [Citrobacter sp. NCU1]NDO79644.1 phosphoenolpyruvate--protein phosphotransferase [Citrobacter sp. NCU1]